MEQEAISQLLTPQFIISIIISVVMAVGFICWQAKEYQNNLKGIGNLARFFSKKQKYDTYDRSYYVDGDEKTAVTIKDVAEDDAELKSLIKDINGYIFKSKGTVAFSIIQNKTERRISMLYEIATSKLSFPTHIGLMGTFAGVFVGLIMFLIGTFFTGGITDTTIQSLITGVLVSMITSCVGIGMLIGSHRAASNATNQIDKDKNEFYEWVQNELMPTVDVSMVEAIGKLHETIDQFEPTFSGVINEFKDAFKDVTGAFGDDFRLSVEIVRDAVEKMGENIAKINENIDLQNNLLGTIKSRELITGMDAFVEASKRFSEITGSLDQFEKARRLMLVAAQEAINIQKDYNESLQIPKQVASEINSILNRITTFERNIEGLGENIAHTQLVGSNLVEQIKENLNAIRSKQKVAEKAADTANEKLEHYFDEHKKELGRIAQKYNEALESYLTDYENMLQERKTELENRKREFTQAIDEKLSISDIRSEFTSLKKLNDIAQKLEQLVQNGVKSGKLSGELQAIKGELEALNDKESKGGGGGFTVFGGGSSSDSDRRKINQLESTITELKEQLEKVESTKSTSSSDKARVAQLESTVAKLQKQLEERQNPQSTSPVVSVTGDKPTSATVRDDKKSPISQEQLDKWVEENKRAKELRDQVLAEANEVKNTPKETPAQQVPNSPSEKEPDSVNSEENSGDSKKPWWKVW